MKDEEKHLKFQVWEFQIAMRETLSLFTLFILYTLPTGLMILIAQQNRSKFSVAQDTEALIIMTAVLILVLRIAQNKQLLDNGKLRALWKGKFWILGGFVSQVLLLYLIPLFLTRFHIVFAVSQNQTILDNVATRIPNFLMIVATTVYAPICEEIIFRAGIFLRVFPNRHSLSFLLSTLLFAFAHMGFSLDWYNWLFYLTMGSLLGIVFLETKKVENTIAAHFLWNIFASIINLG